MDIRGSLRPAMLLVCGAAFGGSMPAASQDLASAEMKPIEVGGELRVLRFALNADKQTAKALGRSAGEVAEHALRLHASRFDGSNGSTYRPVRTSARLPRYAGAITALRYAQTFMDIPVFGAELIVSVRDDGHVVAMAGEVSRERIEGIDLVPGLTQEEGSNLVRDYFAARRHVPASSILIKSEGLKVLDPAILAGEESRGQASLVWHYTASASTQGLPIRSVVLLDADSGTVRLTFSDIHTTHARRADSIKREPTTSPRPPLVLPSQKVLGLPTIATFTADNSEEVPGLFLCDQGTPDCTGGVDPDADSAHRHAAGVYGFYQKHHQRDSIDDNGMALISSVHFSSGFCNAFWDGVQMTYGDGCDLVVDDVVAHELTHGVTEYTSGLFYYAESGAINESLSDVWGELYDLSTPDGQDTPENRWSIGEELGGFRNMRNPPDFFDPDRVGSPLFFTDPLDGIGVHFNSGVNNKAAYLMVDGDTFNGHAIEGIGLDKTLQIYYLVQSTMLTPASNYADLGEYLVAACDMLIGVDDIGAADCEQVEKTVSATEMRMRSPLLPDAADTCPAGQLAQNALFDDFENPEVSNKHWTTVVDQGTDPWVISSKELPLSGSRSLRADNLPIQSTSATSLVDAVQVPENGFVRFEHKYLWEAEGWDGAVVEFSVDDGVTWQSFDDEAMSGERYPGIVDPESSSLLAGERAFVGDSFGAASTRISLKALTGESLKIRFLAATDLIFHPGFPDGWWIDNVQIYSCVDAPASVVVTQPATPWTSEDGETTAFSVQLASAPSAVVSIPLVTTDAGEGVVTSQALEFTPQNWNVPQVVTVTGVDDAIVDGNVPYRIDLQPVISADAGYAGIDPDDVPLVNLDNDLLSPPPSIFKDGYE